MIDLAQTRPRPQAPLPDSTLLAINVAEIALDLLEQRDIAGNLTLTLRDQIRLLRFGL